MLEISPNEQSSENATLRLLLKETKKKKQPTVQSNTNFKQDTQALKSTI